MEWTNEIPEVDGHYWIVEKYFEEDKLIGEYGPSVCYISVSKDDGYIDVAQLGTDVNDGMIPNGEEGMMIYIDENVPRNSVFVFDDPEERTNKLKDLVTKRWEYWIKPIQEEMSMNDSITPYPETHQFGNLSVEMEIARGIFEGDVGVQIASDGRIWLCYNGQALIRFKPTRK